MLDSFPALDSFLPWLILIGGLLGFYFVFKILKKTLTLGLLVLAIAAVAAVAYFLLR